MGAVPMNAHCLAPNWVTETRDPYNEGNYRIAESATDAERRRDSFLLLQAIATLPTLSRERGYGEVSLKSIYSAVQIAEGLPTNRSLPKVTVDEDGDILMVWGEPIQQFALTIEGETIHMVVNPGTVSNHLHPVIYYGGYLPLAILEHVPNR
jgi:hypothetical protein